MMNTIPGGEPPAGIPDPTGACALSPSRMRILVLEQSRRAGIGHIGSALSVVEIVSTLYGSVLRIPGPDHPDRDRFILSKGHAALALYAALHLRGWISQSELDTFCGDGSRLGVHPSPGLPGVDFGTGSLGHGLSIAAGAALAARRQSSNRTTYVLMSDAELNEGSVWEAVMFAAHHRLGTIVAIVDVNQQQALGCTREVLDLAPLAVRWASFGWDVAEIDGHQPRLISDRIGRMKEDRSRPHVLLAHTVFGKGVSFMERQLKWHYSPLSEEEFARALQEVRAQS